VALGRFFWEALLVIFRSGVNVFLAPGHFLPSTIPAGEYIVLFLFVGLAHL
jgi:hypothetical protein